MKNIKLFEQFLNESVYDKIPVKKKADMKNPGAVFTSMGKFKFGKFTVEIKTNSGHGWGEDQLGEKYLVDVSIYDGKKFLDQYRATEEQLKSAKDFKEIAKSTLEEYLKEPAKPQSTDLEDEEEPNAEQTAYIKKRALANIKTVTEIFIGADGNQPIPSKYKKNKEITEDTVKREIEKAKPLVDGAGLTALMVFGTYYLYVVPDEVFKAQEFGDSDNEFSEKIDKGEHLVVVMV